MDALAVLEVIDVEAIASEFPDGTFIAKIHDDCFDDHIFECLYGHDNYEGWQQLLVGESMAGSYVSDGQVVFISPSGDVEWTQESSVKRAEDITLLQLPSMDAKISETLRII